MFSFPDDGRATNPSSTQEAIAQVRSNFPTANCNAPSLSVVAGLSRGSHFHLLVVCHIQIVENFENKSEPGNTPSGAPADGDIELVREAKKNVPESLDYSYSERDVILYNLSVGATEQELHWTFENHEEFAALPTFGVIPQFMTGAGISMDFLPNYNPVCNPLVLRLRVRPYWCLRTCTDHPAFFSTSRPGCCTGNNSSR